MSDEFCRVLTCNGCGLPILVYEEPIGWIDPDLYIGEACGCSEREQLALGHDPPPEMLSEERHYDPMQALIPF